MQKVTLSVYKDEVWLPGGQQVARHVGGEAGDLQQDVAAVQYSTVQYSTVQYSTVQYSIVQYSTVKYIVPAAEAVARQLPPQQLGHQVLGQRGRASHRPQLQAQGRTLPDKIGLIGLK